MVLEEEEVNENGNIQSERKSYYATRTSMLNPSHVNQQLNQWSAVQDHRSSSDEFTSNGQSNNYQPSNSAMSNFVGEFNIE